MFWPVNVFTMLILRVWEDCRGFPCYSSSRDARFGGSCCCFEIWECYVQLTQLCTSARPAVIMRVTHNRYRYKLNKYNTLKAKKVKYFVAYT